MKKAVLTLITVISILTIFTACTVQPNAEIKPPGGDTSLPPTDGTGDIEPLPPETIPPGDAPEPEPDTKPEEPPEIPKLKYVKAKVNSLNIRSKADASSQSLGSIDADELVEYHGKSGSFYITRYREKTAYISANAKYTELIELAANGTPAVENALKIGGSLLGMPYELGAQRLHWGNGIMNTNFTGATYDCSSLMQYMFYKSNKTLLDVTTRKQVLQGVSVARPDLKRGDLLFYTNSYRYDFSGVERIGHVGVYLGGGYMLHTASDHALIEPISAKRWSYYITARRVA